MSALSFQPAERDVRYQTTIQHHWSKKWKHFSWSASGTKFRNLMATIGLPSTSDYSDYSKLKLYITDRTSVSLDISFRWSSDITPMNFPREGKPEMEGEHNKVVFHPATMQFGLVSLLLLFLCVHRRDERPVAKQTAFQSFIVDDGVDDRELKKLSCFFFEMWF